ncbi:MAG: hypothetical protein EU531_09805 [Promethearchaeota archaeon]|nr:MAG: hypothetical protein EU531_09805 [Candidatus Lokiarchaeota archaeon]
MVKEPENSNLSLFKRIVSYNGIIFISIGILARVFMLIFYYWIQIIQPGRSWGDIETNYYDIEIYPPLTQIFLLFFKFLSFGSLEVLAFWAFFFDILIMIQFYFVLKSFEIPNKIYAYGLFFINPFLFLNNVFSLSNCGYHITDSFFFLLFFTALYYYPKTKKIHRYLFYSFLALSIAAKLYTLPVLGFLFLKLIYEKDWEEFKIFLITHVVFISIFLISPFFFLEGYIEFFGFWNLRGEGYLPFYIRIIPAAVLAVSFLLFRFKKADALEIIFVSIFVMASFIFFSNPYIRYFQPFIFLGILRPKLYFTININLKITSFKLKVDNNLLIFIISVGCVLIAFLLIIFVLEPTYF